MNCTIFSYPRSGDKAWRCFATQYAMSPNFGKMYETECLNTKFPLRTFLYAGYIVKLKKKTYSNLLQKMSILGEYLHSGTFVAAVADHKLAGGAHHRHLTGVPQLPLLLARDAKVELVVTWFVEYLENIASIVTNSLKKCPTAKWYFRLIYIKNNFKSIWVDKAYSEKHFII